MSRALGAKQPSVVVVNGVVVVSGVAVVGGVAEEKLSNGD